MPRITKVVTRTGDGGTTALGGGRRVGKDHPRIAAYGTVDELNSSLGVVLASGVHEDLADPLRRIQNELFHLGADLSTPEEDQRSSPGPRVREDHVAGLDSLVEGLEGDLPPLSNFVLPGGTPAAAWLQVARTVCRRAERLVVALSRDETVNPVTIRYLNRLSDVLFLMARRENRLREVPEPVWDSRT